MSVTDRSFYAAGRAFRNSGRWAMKRVSIVGYGAIGESVARELLRSPRAVSLQSICVRPARLAECRAAMPDYVRVTSDMDEVLAAKPDIVIEAAGHEAVLIAGRPALKQGSDLYVLSVGALADEAVRGQLTEQARVGSSQLMIPCGALAGFDGLLALRERGLKSVHYTSTKPPAAWRGTAIERQHDLDGLTEPLVFFDGNAREAALQFPRNANLAAAVAIAGVGFDATRVRLVADPGASGNTGRLVAEADSTRLDLTLSGSSFGDNPKTSEITSMSVVAALHNAAAVIRFI